MESGAIVVAVVGAGIDPAWDVILALFGGVLLLVGAPLAVAWLAGWYKVPPGGRGLRSTGNGERDRIARRLPNWPV